MSDTADIESEHEALLGFLYICPIGILQIDGAGDILLANPKAAEIMLAVTRTPTMLNLFSALEHCAPDLRHMVWAHTASHGMICDQHRIFVRGEGPGARVLACSLIKVHDSSIMAVLQDITRQVEQERILAQNDILLDALLAGINDFALFSIDGEGRIESWNAACVRQIGLSAHEAMGMYMGQFYRPGRAQAGRLLEQIGAATREGWNVQDGWCERRDGSRFSCQVLITVVEERATPTGSFSVIMRDITERRMTSDELRRLLTTDQMTGALNRGRFFDLTRAHTQLCEEKGLPLSVIMLDVDHFKKVNDTFGHAMGDEVLRRLVLCCQAQLGADNIFARLGGEEFAILLPDTDLAEAARTAERLRAAVAAGLTSVDGKPIGGTISLGCASARRPIPAIDDLLKTADAALYNAKREGRNRVCLAAAAPRPFTLAPIRRIARA